MYNEYCFPCGRNLRSSSSLITIWRSCAIHINDTVSFLIKVHSTDQLISLTFAAFPVLFRLPLPWNAIEERTHCTADTYLSIISCVLTPRCHHNHKHQIQIDFCWCESNLKVFCFASFNNNRLNVFLKLTLIEMMNVTSYQKCHSCWLNHGKRNDQQSASLRSSWFNNISFSITLKCSSMIICSLMLLTLMTMMLISFLGRIQFSSIIHKVGISFIGVYEL